MGFISTIVGPIIAGSVLGVCAIGGLVWSQTSPPSDNPASKPILTYGDR